MRVHQIPQIPCGKVIHVQELTYKDGPGCFRVQKAINSRVRPTKFSVGREQGFPGYPRRKRTYIPNQNVLHVCRVKC